jgi:hypothetical protein
MQATGVSTHAIFLVICFSGTWDLHNGNNLSGQIPTFEKMSGNVIFELMSLATEIHGIHYIKVTLVVHWFFFFSHLIQAALMCSLGS